MKDKIIRKYGRVLRKGSIKTIVDLNKSLPIDFNFQLHNINDLVTEFEGIMPPNRISHYVMAFIQKGSGKKVIGRYSFEIEPNMAMIFPKNVIHSTNKWSLDTSGYMLSFDESLFEDHQFPKSFLQLTKLFKLSVTPHCVLDNNTSKMVRFLFEDLKKLKAEKDPNSQKVFILKLAELILVYQKSFLSCGDYDQGKDTLFDQFLERLEKDYKAEKEVNYYAARLSVHSNYLNKIVRSASGITAKEYINNRIVQEAKYLLTVTSIPVKEIAHDLGFNDYNYFSRFFKKMVHVPPQQYRTNNS